MTYITPLWIERVIVTIPPTLLIQSTSNSTLSYNKNRNYDTKFPRF